MLIAGAKAYFIAASALIALGLPRFLGPERFGEFKVVNSFISVLNMVLILGTIQTVSKLVSEDTSRAVSARGQALRLQLGVGGAVSLIVVLAAPWIATTMFKDLSLAPYLRIGAGVTLCYSIYAVYVGVLNGLKRFGAQARLDMLFSTLKVSLIVGLVLTGYGVGGAFAGFLAASVVTVVVAAPVAARHLPPAGEATVSLRRIATLLAPILGSTLMINLILQLDVLAIKGLVGGGTEAASRVAGLFGGAKNISLLPYQATFALTFVVFPMLSQSTFDEDRERSANYVRQAVRFLLLMAGLACVPLITTARPLLEIVLGAAYGASTEALMIMLPTTLLTAALVLSVTILNAAGEERLALVLTTGTVLVNGALLFVALDGAGPDPADGALTRAAWATAAAVAVGFAVAATAVRRRLGAFAPASTVFRLIVVGGGIVALARLWPVDSLVMLVIKALVTATAFLAGMVLLGELTDDDRSTLKRIIGRAT